MNPWAICLTAARMQERLFLKMSAGCCGWIRMDITIITAITITLIMTGSRGMEEHFRYIIPGA